MRYLAVVNSRASDGRGFSDSNCSPVFSRRPSTGTFLNHTLRNTSTSAAAAAAAAPAATVAASVSLRAFWMMWKAAGDRLNRSRIPDHNFVRKQLKALAHWQF
jgi:hypothetical protein